MKSLFTQIWNRKRSNAWILVELLLVFCLVWYITDYFFVLCYNKSIPDYQNTDNVWMIRIGEYPVQYPDYKEEEGESAARAENFRRAFAKIKSYPGVEYAVPVEDGSFPGAAAYNSIGMRSPGDSSKLLTFRSISTTLEGDYFRVFKNTADGGKTPVSIKDFAWNGSSTAVLCRTAAQKLNVSVGENFGHNGTLRLVGIIDDTKRFDYNRPELCIYKVRDASESRFVQYSMLAVRLHSSAPAFIDAFRKELQDNFKFGNYYFKEMFSINSIAEKSSAMFGYTRDVRLRIYLMAFLLINILLCVMGTFWYRVNRRKEETGIRKAFGAGQPSIRRLFVLEGLALLAIASLPAMLIEGNFAYAGLVDTLGRQEMAPELYLPDRPVLRFFIVNIITWLIMAIVVSIAIWIPARNAAGMHPADVLKHE